MLNLFYQVVSKSLTHTVQMLRDLTNATLLRVSYLDSILLGTSLSGIEAYRNSYAITQSGDPITVVLGANTITNRDDPSEGRFQGRTPLNPGEPNGFSTIFLGSEVSLATITHEFDHQLDRHFGMRLSAPVGVSTDIALNEFLLEGGLRLSNWRNIISPTARAAIPEDWEDQPEIFADLAMLAMLNGLGSRVGEGYGIIRLLPSEIDPTQPTDNARVFACLYPQYLRQLLVVGTFAGFEPESCE